MRTNYVLIDYENIQPDVMPALDGEHFKVIVFVGASQTKVTFELADALQRIGSRAEYVKVSATRSNALDFHIAYYLGKHTASDPTACFHVISNDTGYDPLIAHLKAKNISVTRRQEAAAIPILKATKAKPPGEKLAAVVANLQKRKASLPGTFEKLLNAVDAFFQKRLPRPELLALLRDLQTQGHVAVRDNAISYHFPDAQPAALDLRSS